jgi:peptidoglycan/LPS O-acetylase OafA/YrhL
MKPRTTHGYRADIDGLRALAVLSVVIFHAFPAWLPGGFVGVDIFFVISGYLITGIIAGELQRGQFTLTQFYARRILRIFPALILILIFCLAVGWIVLLQSEYKELGKHALASAAFVQNLMLWSESGYFDGPAELKVLLHLWSLGIEEQFYIVWPVVLFLLVRTKLRVGAVIILLIGISFAHNIYQSQYDLTADFYSPLTRVWELLIGGWLAIKMQKPSDFFLSTRYSNVLAVLGCIAILGSFALIDRYMAFPGYWVLIPVLGAACLLAAGPSSWLGKVALSHKLMVWIGLLSYPLYLWHWPLLTFAKIVENGTPIYTTRLILIGVAILLAWLTYRYIESPIRNNFKNRSLIILSLLVFMCVIAGLGYVIHKNNGFEQRRVVVENRDNAEYVVSDFNLPSPCTGLYSADFLNEFCEQRLAPNGKRTIVLWGDSSAVVWSPVFETIAKQENYNLVRIAMLGCPPILGASKVKYEPPALRLYCSDGTSQQRALNYIKQIKPDMVVVIAAWNQYSGDPPTELLIDGKSGSQVASAVTTQLVLEKNLPETLNQLSQISKVLVFRSWPILGNMPNARSVPGLGIKKLETTTPYETFIKNTNRIDQILDARVSPEIQFFSPAQKICDAEACHAERGGVRFYLDPYHITPRGALDFQPELQKIMVRELSN